MNDYIDRQAAIDAVYGAFQVKDVDDFVDYRDIAVETIKVLPSAQSKQQWIPCGERLPEDNSDILITYVEKDEKRIAPVNYGCGTWFDCFFNKVLNPVGVLAWMPLPEPYKGEGEAHETD